MKKVIFLLLVSTLMLGACNDDDSNPRQDALNQNRAKWDGAGLSSYVYQVTRSCFCSPQEAIVVTVTNGVVTDGFFTPSGVMLDQDRLVWQRSMEEFFDFVQDAIDQNADELVVSYDATYGFPTDIYINYLFGLADDEIGYYVREFQ